MWLGAGQAAAWRSPSRSFVNLVIVASSSSAFAVSCVRSMRGRLPFDAACSMPASALVPYVDHLGPVGRALAHADDALRARVMEVVLPAFEPHRRGDEIRFTAACWAIGARA